MKMFPVLHADRDKCAKEIPFFLLDAKWAMKLHYQTLERLAERGGLSAYEIALNYNKLTASAKFEDKSYPTRLVNNLSKQIEKDNE